MNTFIQILILLAVLAAMVMVLLAIRQLAHFESFDNDEDTARLKEEITDDDRIVSQNSIFHNLVDPDRKKFNFRHKKHSNDPLSRRE